ncbi:cupin domain-containing protein [Salinibacterium sp. ZJ450]|uniref:cupin domain-containing protein n=1 Tax=Salinibacterium sp. ZJ450 TaxID=2708338 RepID=UPI0014221C4E|nr:cupin domain-containing protein [Salinibacterium sp. ZJ450]
MTSYERGRNSLPAELGTTVCATTGDVLIDNVLTDEGISVNGAMFKPGAHTFWHSHENGQLFTVTSGRGAIVTRDGKAHIVQAGDVVFTPPGEEHWHGAAPECFVTYTSASLGKTSFAEPVEPEEYARHWNA